ncbi:protein vav isoform X8 [Rhopalosiphum maidis]|uniref:protein vav isoform X8 n=1 Tax=Rhopalosiphum maidis TaxID=43146 RepID=UPI000EFE5790|nr:protein vav isoform X8 [Rhopalosiphum maidis]
MYVIFPADEVVQLSFGRPTTRQRQQQRSGQRCYCNQHRTVPVVDGGNKFLRRDQPMNSMASAMGDDLSLRDLTHPALNESLKTHNAATFKLVKTVSDFTQELSQMYEQHAAELQLLVTNFRKKNTDLRKDRPSFPSQLFYTWETFLQEVETDSKSISDVANVLGRQISRPLLDRSFHRKVQSRKVFSQRDSLELILQKSEDKLSKCREDYKRSFLAQLSSPNSSASLSLYLDAHNAYVTQLHATNGMFDQYNQYVLPQLLQELEDVYSDLCMSLSDAVLQGSDVIYNKSSDQSKRYNALGSQCRQLTPGSDLTAFARSLTPLPTTPHLLQRTRNYCPPQAPTDTEGLILEPGVTEAIAQLALKNELIVDRLASLDVRAGYDTIRAELMDLESQMKQIQDSVETFKRLQQRSLEQSMFTKANELQEDISIKKFEFRTAQMHLAAVKSQKDLFASKLETTESNARDRKLSSSSSGSMKSKWLKAIKSLKTTSGPTNNNTTQKDEKKHQMYHAVSTIIAMRKTGRDGNPQFSANTETAHQFQEYTYKKITPCDFCSQVLRGHTRQGLKCRVCKMNVHLDCQEKVTTRCQVKSRLLRRQKSTSEIETKMAAMNVTGRDDDETPSSPVHNRRLLSTRTIRMSSVELPDDNDKSLSSASTSPCPSPVRYSQKPHRLLPNNLYVVLYNFKARREDELDLKAGYKVTVIDTSDPAWWKGKCFGRVGYFPYNYVTKVQPGERPWQVTINLQVLDVDNNPLTLLRDQIVIQIGEGPDGSVMIRNAENKQGMCPVKFLQEV